MKDTCDQEIIPRSPKVTLSTHTNRHTTQYGNSWGWIEGCTLNICWSNDSNLFNSKMASDLCTAWNAGTLELAGITKEASK